MRYLFYFGSCFNIEFLGELLDEAVKLSKEQDSNKVYFLNCSGVNRYCMFNQGGSKFLCKWCSYCTRKIIEKYDVEYIPLSDFANRTCHDVFGYNNAEELRHIQYRGVQIGLGIMSTYISLTRNMNPKLNNKARHYFDEHLNQNQNFVDSLYDAINKLSPDCIYSYNGRFEENRAVYDIGRILGLKTVMIEDYTNLDDLKKYKTAFINALPHTIVERSRIYKYCWDRYALNEEEKIKLGKSFYHKRRGGERSGDVRIYTAGQKEGSAPMFDSQKINVAIMNSSEDEYAAVGDEWDNLKMFKTQYDGIVYLLQNSPKNVHYYLRIHPNLMNIRYKYHTQLLELDDRYDNITVISSDSEFSTYTIMEKCDKVVGFGSTMCIEASYWGKPSILLGPAIFYYDNVCYVPKEPKDVIELILKPLEPIWSDNILKFGACIVDMTPFAIDTDTQFKYVDFNISFHKFIKRYISASYIDFFINEKFTALLIAIVREVLTDHSFRIPLEEV